MVEGFIVENKLDSIIFKLIFGLFFILMTITLVLVLFFQSSTEYQFKISCSLPNSIFVLIGLTCLVFLSLLVHLIIRSVTKAWPVAVSHKIHTKILIVLTILLAAFQYYLCYNSYFLTDWDVGVVLENTRALALGDFENVYYHYFSLYPNNNFLEWFFFIIFKIEVSLGITDLTLMVLPLILLQCILSALAAFLLYRVCLDWTKSHTVSWCAWIVYVIFIGTSPWLFIPYTDSMGLIFPILILWCYRRLKYSPPQQRLRWSVLLGIFTFLGFEIKVQTFIVFIAICIVELITCLQKQTFRVKLLARVKSILVIGAVFVFGNLFISLIAVPSMHISIDQNCPVGITHYLMMGANTELNGTYSQDDVNYSISFPDTKSRTAANISTFKQRISDIGVVGLIKHLAKKTLVNYADGTFAWAQDGNGNMQLLPDKNNTTSPFLKSLFYTNETGTRYQQFRDFKQIIWLTTLFASLGMVFCIFKGRKPENGVLVAVLSIIGLTIFELIFESRARYLYTYAPIYILLGVLGWRSIWHYLQQVRRQFF